MNRRGFLTRGLSAATVAAAGTGLTVAAAEPVDKAEKRITILGIACSVRKGKTTATAVQVALDAAKAVDPRIDIDLIDLGDMTITGWTGSSAKPTDIPKIMDDFEFLIPKLQDPDVAAWIIGSPVYFRTMSAVCKAFLERCAVLRTPTLKLANKYLGALAVGAFRNGGQELVIEQIHAAMLCQDMFIVGGKPNAHQGATLWNNYQDDILKDEFGIDTAKKLGVRVAEAALKSIA